MLLTKNDKMKAHIRYFILILGIAFLTGCCLQKTHFTAEEMQWLNPYEEGDTLIFQSAKGEVDTSWIVQKTIYHSRAGCNPINAHGTHQYHTGRIYYQNSTEKYSSGGRSLISIMKTRKRTGFSVSYIGTTYSFYDVSEVWDIKSDSIYIFQARYYNHPNARSDQIDYLHWHENHGIIKYITHAGVEWKRINMDYEVE